MAKSIIGDGFDEYVQKQIEVRQEKLNLGLQSLDTFQFNNTNSPFIRLTSGVNVDGSILKDNGIDWNGADGSAFAKQYKLFSARTLSGSQEIFTHGLGYNNESSYGFASSPDYGYVPPPGIKSIDIKAMNRGSLREANISIECHNLQQFQIIEILYLRLKYSILLEWGHSVYFNNKGELVQSIHNLSDNFLSGNFDQQDMLDLVRQERAKSFGNYDAFFGLITNFSWTLRPDGGYSVTVTARSSGDVIESLKLNTSYPSANPASTTSNAKTALQNNYYKSTINKILNAMVQQTWDGNGKFYAHGVEDGTQGAGNSVYTPIHNYNIEWMADLKAVYNRTSKSDINKKGPYLVFNEIMLFLFSQLPNGVGGNGQYYMKLGTLLRIIESFLLVYDNAKPHFQIDYNYDTNHCLTTERHCSVDPKVCLIEINDSASVAGGALAGKNIIKDITYSYSEYKVLLNVSPPEYYTSAVAEATQVGTFPTSNIPYKQNGDFLGKELAATGATQGANITSTITALFSDPAVSAIPNIYSYNYIIDDGQAQLRASSPIGYKFNIKVNKLKKDPFTGGFNDDFQRDEFIETDTSYIGFDAGGIRIKVDYPNLKLYTVDNVGNITGDYFPYAAAQDEVTEYKTLINSNVPQERRDSKVIVRQYIDAASNVGGVVIAAKDQLYPRLKGTGFKTPKSSWIGNTMHMFINMEYIATTLDKYVNTETGAIALYDFLTNLMSGVQNALGNINNFEVIYSEEKNKFSIIDNTFIPGTTFGNKISSFNANILKNTKGSFITNVNFKTKLSNNFATMTTIGAQKNGNVVGSNSTMLSKWNNGLTDRIIPNRSNPNADLEDAAKVELTYINNILNLQTFNGKVTSLIVTDNDINSLRNGIVDLFNADLGAYTNAGNIKGIGFIPFDLELTMLGLSGPKIYESYTIDTTLLPAVYKDKVQFICSGVSHKVDDNGWTTTLNSICGPKYQGVVVSNGKGVKNITSVAQPSPTPPKGGGKLRSAAMVEALKGAGYVEGSFDFEFALVIGTKEGFKGSSSTNLPSRNNNPGNLDYQASFKTLDPGVILDPSSGRFAKFTTPELGAKALVEYKIKRWADGNFPSTAVNSKNTTYQNTWNVPAAIRDIYGKNVKMTIEAFIYTYAPPSGNDTELYITQIITALKPKYPSITRFDKIIDYL